MPRTAVGATAPAGRWRESRIAAVRSWLPIAALLAGSSLVAFLGLEIATRLANDEGLAPTKNYVSDALVASNLGLTFVDHHPVVGWVHASNFQGPPGAFTTGEFGVRMKSDRIEPLPRGAILAVGDSFTAGSEVASHESWPAQLEDLLGEPVINAGVGGWGVDQIVLRAEELIPELRPHTVVIGIFTQDNLRNTLARYGGAYKPYFTVVDGALQLQNSPVPGVRRTPRELGYVRSVLGYSYFMYWAAIRLNVLDRWVDDRLRYEKVHKDRRGVEITCLLMPRLAQLQRSTGTRVVVVLEYDGQQVLDREPIWYGPRTIECAKSAGLEGLDTLAAFREVAARDMDEFRSLYVMHDNGQTYGHMSAKGNGLVARLLREEFFRKSEDAAPAPGRR